MSLGFFPTFCRDELLYSAFARYSDRTDYPNVLSVFKDLFGNQNVAAVVDLPNRLDRLIGELPSGHNYTADRLISDRTLLPFYEPFLPPYRAKLVRSEMKRGGDNHIRAMLGITAGGVITPSHLRFCPVCINEDCKEYSEPYWHRIHQITGIEVCSVHLVFLESSNVSWHGRARQSNRLLSAKQVVQTVAPRPLDINKKPHNILLRLANDGAWLLSQHKLTLDNAQRRNRYYNALLERGYAYYNGRIRTSKLQKAFFQFYPPEFLALFKIEAQSKNWLLRLLHPHRTAVQNPLYHLLLITFLEYSAEEFFTNFREYKPFGKGPWPCLNQASNHYGGVRIKKCRVTDNLSKRKSSRPMGTFSCNCGFVYIRVGPDTTEKDLFRLDSVQSYGQVWEKVLRKHWNNTDITVQTIAEKLGVSHLTVTRHAIRLKLTMNTPGARAVSN